MNIPKTLKIGAHQYEVIFPYQFTERTGICGQCDNRLRRITISETDGNGEPRPDTDILGTLFHEILHAIDSVYCSFQIGKECRCDDLTEAIAQGLAQVYIDNPGMREMLLGYTSKPSNIIKIRNDNKTYTLSDFGQGFDLQNEFEESMTLTEKSLFDILDEFFQREF